MAKHENRHLTTEQLSAYIDQQLSQQEQGICKLHLQTCEQCQTTLATLQQTIALLKALPEPALPHSFVLPAGDAYLQEQPAMPTPSANRRSWSSYLRRSLRAASAIAAVVGLIFLLTGVLPTLHLGGAGGNVPTSSNAGTIPPNTQRGSAAGTAGAYEKVHTPATVRERTGGNQPNGSGAHTPAAQPKNTTPTTAPSTPIVTTRGKYHEVAPASPFLNVNTDIGRQEVGWLLIVLGVVGILLSRRKRVGT